jgi:hypothetical protein
MTEPSFQTVRLSPGRHASPEEGACVVELASLVAGEPFSDRPRSVSPVLAAFLRCYNDLASERRQDLVRVAAEIVGTRVGERVERTRLRLCMSTFDELAGGDDLRRIERWVWRRVLAHVRRRVSRGHITASALEEFAYALALMLRRRGVVGHGRAMQLVDDLVALGRTPAPPAPVTPARRERDLSEALLLLR